MISASDAQTRVVISFLNSWNVYFKTDTPLYNPDSNAWLIPIVTLTNDKKITVLSVNAATGEIDATQNGLNELSEYVVNKKNEKTN